VQYLFLWASRAPTSRAAHTLATPLGQAHAAPGSATYDLKEEYMTAFSHKLIHNSITQSNASRSIRLQMTATFHT